MQEWAMAHPILTFLMFWIGVWGAVVIVNAITLPFRRRPKKAE